MVGVGEDISGVDEGIDINKQNIIIIKVTKLIIHIPFST